METENIPTLGEWFEKLPLWKRVLFLWWYPLPHVGWWALVVLGYSRAKRVPELPRDAPIKWDVLQKGQIQEEESQP